MRLVDSGAQNPSAILIFLALSHPLFSGEGDSDSPVAAQVETAESNQLPRLRYDLWYPHVWYNARPGALGQWYLGWEGLGNAAAWHSSGKESGWASGRPGLRAISAIHQLCDFVTSLSLCFLILKSGEVVREPTSKNWHEDVECLARGLSFSVALITMPAVRFQPCQSPLPGLPAVPAMPQQPTTCLYLLRLLI